VNTRQTSDTIRERLLAVRCQLGDRDAMEELVRTWERRLLFYVRRFATAGQDEALHVMQDVWLRVFSSINNLRDPDRLAPWLYTLTRRTLTDRLRDRYTREQLLTSRKSSSDDGDDLATRCASTDDTSQSWFVAAEEVHFGLSRVSVVEREVLTLYFLEDLSIDEIAKVIGVPPGTVKSRLFHARAALRNVLQRKDGPRP
jgi:RNA polymerase sigma-70 factor (ECF subfamily)